VRLVSRESGSSESALPDRSNTKNMQVKYISDQVLTTQNKEKEKKGILLKFSDLKYRPARLDLHESDTGG
jgi:hypothetical protein